MTRAGSRQNLRVLDALLSDTLGFRSKSVTINACVLMTPAGNEIGAASRVPVAIALKGIRISAFLQAAAKIARDVALDRPVG